MKVDHYDTHFLSLTRNAVNGGADQDYCNFQNDSLLKSKLMYLCGSSVQDEVWQCRERSQRLAHSEESSLKSSRWNRDIQHGWTQTCRHLHVPLPHLHGWGPLLPLPPPAAAAHQAAPELSSCSSCHLSGELEPPSSPGEEPRWCVHTAEAVPDTEAPPGDRWPALCCVSQQPAKDNLTFIWIHLNSTGMTTKSPCVKLV